MSVDDVRRADADPACKKHGFSHGPFYIGQGSVPTVVIGNMVMRQVRTHIRIFNDAIFTVKAPETDGAPFRLTAQVFDKEGAPIIRIVDNQWQTRADNWDVIAAGGKITIRRGPGDIALVLRVEPPSALIVERMDFFHRGVRIECREGEPVTITREGGSVFQTNGLELHGSDEGLVFDDRGMRVGVGGGFLLISSLTVSNGPVQRSTSTFREAVQPRIVADALQGMSPEKYATTHILRPEVFERTKRLKCSCGSGKEFGQCHGRVK